MVIKFKAVALNEGKKGDLKVACGYSGVYYKDARGQEVVIINDGENDLLSSKKELRESFQLLSAKSSR